MTMDDAVWRRSKLKMAVQRPIPPGLPEELGDLSCSNELRSWSRHGFKGLPAEVHVYTCATRVKLLLNGKEIDTQKLQPSDELKTEFTVPYSSGELKAIAYNGDTETVSVAFTTIGQPHHLILIPDKAGSRPAATTWATSWSSLQTKQAECQPLSIASSETSGK